MKPHIISRIIICCFFILNLKTLANAQVSEKSVQGVHIDGTLNEAIWLGAKKFTDFSQFEPEIFAPSMVKSELYFTYDSQNIYVGGKLFQDKSTISAGNARKDDLKTTSGDCIAIAIDPLNNENSAYFFLINPVNAQADGTLDASGNNSELGWDAVFISEAKIFDTYWTFELMIPLTSINFQNKEIQTWGVQFMRKYAHAPETSVNQLLDKNAPYRVSDFYKINDITGLKKEKKIVFIPYLYSYGNNFQLNDSLSFGASAGGEIKYNPSPSTTILATFNPDYAQIETDKEVINVSDLPTTYPEKRPFFTESSDMYPGLAVNTRNITDINAGLKIRNVSKNAKIDFTAVSDKQKNLWGFGNIRLTDNKKYHIEIISGLKSPKSGYFKDYNYNVTLHGKLYFFNRQMQAYSWYGTINSARGAANNYESVNAVKWISRTWTAGIWNHFKSELYNPDIVGSPELSNQFIIDSWLGYTLYNEKGLFRKITLTSHVLRTDLFDNRGNAYFENTTELNNQFYLGNTLGKWEAIIVYKPGITKKFRFRNPNQFNNQDIFVDAISKFVLVDQSANSFNISLKTDLSKRFGMDFNYDNSLVRKSKASSYSLESFFKLGSKAIITYSYRYLDIARSDYQNKFKQAIHRIKAEYNVMDKMNIRMIFQPNKIELPYDELSNQNFNSNLTVSYEFMPGGSFYLVYNNYKNYDQFAGLARDFKDNNHTIILKISKTI